MARLWWRPVCTAWLLTVAPLFALAAVWCGRFYTPTLAVLWWLQPLYDRVPLFVLSRALDGEAPGWRQVLRELPRLWGRDLAGALLWRRADPMRSFHLPVHQLEHLPARTRWRRLRALDRGARASAVSLTAACTLMQLGLYLALFALLLMLVPEELLGKALGAHSPLHPEPWWANRLWLALAFCAFSAVEPAYVAAGFALHLGQRTRLDGWDVEIALRRLGERLAAAGRSAGVRVALGLTLAAAAGAAWAAEAPGAAPSPASAVVKWTHLQGGAGAAGVPPGDRAAAAAAHALAQVLALPELDPVEQQVTWERRLPRKDGDDSPHPLLVETPRWLRGSVRALLVVVMLYLLVRWRGVRQAQAWRPERDAATGEGMADRPPPERLAGHDVRAATLPADVPAAAWELWEQGQPAAALGMLYRGALTALLAGGGIPFQASWTEGDCLRAVLAAGTAGATAGCAGFFAGLTAAWQAAAYAGRPPAPQAMRSLCAGWNLHLAPLLPTHQHGAGGGTAPGADGGSAVGTDGGAARREVA